MFFILINPGKPLYLSYAGAHTRERGVPGIELHCILGERNV